MIALPLAVILAIIVGRLMMRRYEGRLATAGAVSGWTPTAVVRVPLRWPTVRTLGTGEVRRLFLHPLVLVGLLLGIFTTGFETGDDKAAYFTLTGAGATGLYLPTLTFLAAVLTTTRARRDRTEDVLVATPTDDVDRTLAMAVTGVAAAGAVLAGVVVAYAGYRAFGVEMARTPGPLELLPLPLSVLGGITLGAMVGRWLPYRGVGPVALVVLVMATGVLAGDLTSNAELFAPYVELIPWDKPPTDVPLHRIAGHDLYLLGLDSMAVIGGVLHDRRTLRWWVLGFVAVVFTALMGVWQVS